MFILQEQPINIPLLKDTYANNAYGALVSFEGMVRADQKSRSDVEALLYIADIPLCKIEGNKITEEVLLKFPVAQAVCVQRYGQVHAGQSAIWIGVWSSHRAQCFEACQYIIENVKKRLVIWKKEILTDGSARWIYGEQTPVIV